jgi:hypothetical protein
MRGLLKSTRFVVIQEGFLLGFISCILYASILPRFPIKDFLLYLAPIVVGIYGIKTAVEHKQNGIVDRGKIPD